MPTQLPILKENGGRTAIGYFTPLEDRSYQTMLVPPRLAIPIVFLPGIMGSNLRMSPARQRLLEKSNNIAWKPDSLPEAAKLMVASPAQRQLQLDPDQTVVDATDTPFETEVQSVFLIDDLPTYHPRKTKTDKARERGWGEVYFASYKQLLESCEEYLNTRMSHPFWQSILDRPPGDWGAVQESALQPLSSEDFRAATTGRWFPVHAMGYNWLEGNGESAIKIAKRLKALIADYRSWGYECEKVIIVTHSMGGLVARALVHPAIGNAASLVLGVVHGAMPANGAPAAYKRMRCGFEQGLLGLSPTARVLGDTGFKVTAVLGNSLGGLQLLPSKAYGNGWLQVRRNRVLFDRFPQHGDPYEEIYKVENRWYGLLRPEWLNPARDKNAGVERTRDFLDDARKFHETIDNEYHPLSYAHYGADPHSPSWETVTWNLGNDFMGIDWKQLHIEADDEQGQLELVLTTQSKPARQYRGSAELGPCSGAGDQTVPARSSDSQLLSGKFKGIFRQTSYEHQASYQDEKALHSTLYSIIKIASTMRGNPHDGSPS
jgi:pimeloyl-ACP methyl ester carboxylesterase